MITGDDGFPCEECGGWHAPDICPECRQIRCSNCRCEAEDDDSDDGYAAESRDTPADLEDDRNNYPFAGDT